MELCVIACLNFCSALSCVLQNIYWSDSGDLVAISSDNSFYILKYKVRIPLYPCSCFWFTSELKMGKVICNMMVGCSVDIKLITDVSHNLGEHMFVC